MRLFLLIITGLILASCETKPTPKGRMAPIIAPKDYPVEKDYNADIPPPPTPDIGPQTLCFEQRQGPEGEDVTSLRIITHNDSIIGDLNYLPSQGTAIRGKVEGMMMGRLMDLIYTYKMEGVQRSEEIIYKLDNDKLYRKTGAMIDKDGISVLENPAKASFVLALEKVKCNK